MFLPNVTGLLLLPENWQKWRNLKTLQAESVRGLSAWPCVGKSLALWQRDQPQALPFFIWCLFKPARFMRAFPLITPKRFDDFQVTQLVVNC